jgi:putative membrane protein
MWYYQYYWGMNLIWWMLWFILMIWIFVTPYYILGQRYKREDVLDVLKKRFAQGEIDDKAYEESKAILEKN